MTTAETASYFPYSLQIRRSVWERLSLAIPHRDIRQLGKPKSTFYRELAARLTAEGKTVTAGELNLYGLQLKVQRHLVGRYLDTQCPELLPSLLQAAGIPPSSAGTRELAANFCRLFPGEPFLNNPFLEPAEWLTADVAPGREALLATEMLLLSVAATNSALNSFREVIDWSEFAAAAASRRAVDGLEQFLAAAPPVESVGMTLPEMLRLPQRVAPGSLLDQLKFIKQQWGGLVPEEFIPELLTAVALIEEEGRMFLPAGEPAGAPVLEFDGPPPDAAAGSDWYPEPERFSADTDWMPNVVLLAKMVYVWLGQLSKKYDKEIKTLDQIPEEELSILADWGVTGLWLIGLWERSPTSQRIKQLCGNPEAISSAYSLFDYTIAEDLGGEAALLDLKERALRHGIRLASDMVPNHTGIYSKWTVEHPDWFVQLDYPPYPGYSFTGTDLSPSPEVSLHIEDGYWERRDAAVVFKHFDHRNGRTRFIYHGNDGTSTPWNDTAQLDYLNREVREAVINTILHVARMFPIIRFDAAMTLAKKHYQRLWFPQPGHHGVPSRADYGMTREQFDAAMPEEFWRQVVDRIGADAPDTLLLAEAFWLMEGYFVRTLGMHRVYNSAFMNMLKMEENAKYRQTIRNVLEFNPQVLQRFVNFMNNPDEKTAVEQFGRESKYIGATVLLVTMPGLPMLGHGQVEGFHEKYGMEYKQAYWDEAVDDHLVREHERRIFPLMRRRWLFSGALEFRLYDFMDNGKLHEDVFAYSNRAGEHRAIVIYHNRFATVTGRLRNSVPFIPGGVEGAAAVTATLGESLGFKGDGRHYYIWRDYSNGLEYLANGRELCDEGLQARLEAYEYRVLMDFREIWDDEFGTWGALCHQLGGRGVASMDEEVKQIRFAPLIDQLRVHTEHFRGLVVEGFAALAPADLAVIKKKFSAGQREFFAALAEIEGSAVPCDAALATLLAELDFLEAEAGRPGGLLEGETARLVAFAWLLLHRCGELLPGGESAAATALLVRKYGLDRPLEEELAGEAVQTPDALAGLEVSAVLDLFITILRWQELLLSAGKGVQLLFTDPLAARFVRLHKSGGFDWFVKERFEMLLDWLELTAVVLSTGDRVMAAADIAAVKKTLSDDARAAGYRLDRMLHAAT
ncbi:MAG: alpha-amylase [Geobacter sp.]|nr:alpha-amylase [Geobacter sp.]